MALITPFDGKARAERAKSVSQVKIEEARLRAREMADAHMRWVGEATLVATPVEAGISPLGPIRFNVEITHSPPYPVDKMSVLFGQLAHNFRSCLDQVAQGLVAAFAIGMPANLEEVRFPTFRQQRKYEEVSKRRKIVKQALPGVSQDVLDLVMDLAPQLRGEFGCTRMAISILRSMNITDKHHESYDFAVLAASGGMEIQWPGTSVPPFPEQFDMLASEPPVQFLLTGKGFLGPIPLPPLALRPYILPNSAAPRALPLDALADLLIERTEYVVSLLLPALNGMPLTAAADDRDFEADAHHPWPPEVPTAQSPSTRAIPPWR
jgi:hypothetical protein